MNSGARVVNSALVCTQRGRRDGNSNCDRERKRREEDLPPRSLPSNSLVIFISFYWLIFNTICFIFIFFLFWLCELFYYSRSFCHGDGYKHTPNWQSAYWSQVITDPVTTHIICILVQHYTIPACNNTCMYIHVQHYYTIPACNNTWMYTCTASHCTACTNRGPSDIRLPLYAHMQGYIC